jgi:pimeloyl-ACP methyl ester carboxylesterase
MGRNRDPQYAGNIPQQVAVYVVADFLDALQLDGVTLVGSDTGGAICQLVASRHPDRLARLVLTNCDMYHDFPPFPFNWTPYAARIPGLITTLMQPTRLAVVCRLAIRLLTKYPVPDQLLERWARAGLDDRDIRRDALKLVRSLSPRLTERPPTGGATSTAPCC